MAEKHTMMRRILVLVAVLALTVLVVPAAGAAQPVVSIKGQGTADNVDLGAGTVSIFGFKVRENADGTFKGQVKYEAVSPTGTVLAQLHGNVVCIRETDGVLDTDGQGWEIRYQVKKSKGLLGGAFPVGAYASLYVQDDPGGDQFDEGLSLGNRGFAACGLDDAGVVWESVLDGDIEVTS